MCGTTCERILEKKISGYRSYDTRDSSAPQSAYSLFLLHFLSSLSLGRGCGGTPPWGIQRDTAPCHRICRVRRAQHKRRWETSGLRYHHHRLLLLVGVRGVPAVAAAAAGAGGPRRRRWSRKAVNALLKSIREVRQRSRISVLQDPRPTPFQQLLLLLLLLLMMMLCIGSETDRSSFSSSSSFFRRGSIGRASAVIVVTFATSARCRWWRRRQWRHRRHHRMVGMWWDGL